MAQSWSEQRGKGKKVFALWLQSLYEVVFIFFQTFNTFKRKFFEIKSMGPNVNRIWTRRTKALIVARCPLGHMKEGSMSFV